ncbi:MAG: cation diffusion facilitator CzcD-associated flavoprotein CzcO [Arenicella sp.]|jgi:cation diffusion facilitator CzcD-associated flavoprotein CzcO
MGIKLKQAGDDDFVILEKADDLGGTWRENTYPGAECDIPSALYSYSFEHNAEWQSKWSGQEQILKYQHDTATKYSLHPHLKYQHEVNSLVFDETELRWTVTSSTGEQFIAQHVVCAIGQLHKLSTPVFANAEQFQGEVFHSGNWDHSVDLNDKKIAVIGNAASAVQFIPEIAKVAKHLTVFQRSPNWILPKVDRPYSDWEQRISAKYPLVAKLYRQCIWALGEYGVLPAIKGNRVSRWLVRKACLANLNKHVSDPELREKLTPVYPIGAKRVLFSDHYFPALARDNVSLNDSGATSFSANAVVDKLGHETEADVIIYGTGFQTNPFLADIEVIGIGQRTIREAWSDGAQAYLGVSTSGFPNLHLLYGPNTNLGHTSIIIMLEAQVDYIIQAMGHLDRVTKQACDVKSEFEQNYNQELQARLSTMAFSKIENSWYKDGDKVTNNWAGGTREYVKRLKKIDMEAYTLR